MLVWGQSGITKNNRKGAECPHLGSLFLKYSPSHPPSISLLFCINYEQGFEGMPEYLSIHFPGIRKCLCGPEWSQNASVWKALPSHADQQQHEVNKFASSSSSVWNFSLSFFHSCPSKLYLPFKIQLKYISSSEPYLELIHPLLTYSELLV